MYKYELLNGKKFEVLYLDRNSNTLFLGKDYLDPKEGIKLLDAELQIIDNILTVEGTQVHYGYESPFRILSSKELELIDQNKLRKVFPAKSKWDWKKFRMVPSEKFYLTPLPEGVLSGWYEKLARNQFKCSMSHWTIVQE